MWYITILLCAVCSVLCCRSQHEELYKNKMWFAVLICAEDYVSSTRTKCDLPAHCLALSARWARWARWANLGKTSLGQNENLGNNFFEAKKKLVVDESVAVVGWDGMGWAPARWKPDLTEWWSLSQRGERIREGKILFVVAADSLPEKVLCRGHYFQLSTKSFWS